MKLRRINRGIALGCIVAIATTGYIVYDQKQFSKNVGNISQSVKDYLEDLTDAQTSSDDPKQLCENLKDVINKHMTSETLQTSSDFATTPKSEYLSSLNSAPEDYAPTVGGFSKYEVKINNIKVSKYGNNGAVANVNYEMVCEYTENPIECTDSFVTTISNEQEENPLPNDTKQKYRQTKTCNDGEFYFNNVDGEWKLCGISTWYVTTTTPINDKETSSNSDYSDSKQHEKGGADNEQ